MTESTMRQRLPQQLIGSVFHVTSGRAFDGICADGYIAHNSDGRHGAVFPQSTNCLGRHLKAVCLFDLRGAVYKSVEQWTICYGLPTVPQFGARVVYLFVDPAAYPLLLHWEGLTKQEKAVTGHIPEIECWYRGNLPILYVQHAFVINVQRSPEVSIVDLIARTMAVEQEDAALRDPDLRN